MDETCDCQEVVFPGTLVLMAHHGTSGVVGETMDIGHLLYYKQMQTVQINGHLTNNFEI